MCIAGPEEIRWLADDDVPELVLDAERSPASECFYAIVAVFVPLVSILGLIVFAALAIERFHP